MKALTTLCMLLVASSAFSFPLENLDLNLEEEWSSFKQNYRQSVYQNGEEEERKGIFKENLKEIKINNLLYSKGLKSFRMAINQFTDLTLEEFSSLLNGFKMPENHKVAGSTFLSSLNPENLPKHVDWREKGYVTPVKDQGYCGSCWAFSATGSLEGQQFRKTGKLVSLSEQNLMDCSSDFGNNRCHGGLMELAFDYIKSNHGIDTEASYPYEAEDEFKCKFDPKHIGANVTGYIMVDKSEEKLKEALATVGPISIALDADHASFKHYESGIYENPECDSVKLDHGVLLVGYGTENGQDYWLIKNSWGQNWGTDGYIKLARNKNNMCGVATHSLYPLV